MAEEAKNYKANSQSVHEGIARQKEFLNNVNKKREMLKSELAQKEMAECSFKPMTNTKTAPRKLNQFLNDQHLFLEKTKNKIDQMAMEEKTKKESQFKSSPSISKIENEKVGGEEPAYERLYKLSKNNQLDDQQDDTLSHVPAIEERSKTIKRTERVEVSLYNDALRRQNKQNLQPETKSITRSAFNQKSEEFFAKKLIKQLIKNFDIVKDEHTTENSISLNILNELLIICGYIKININDENKLQEMVLDEDKKAMLIRRFTEEKSLLLEMWIYLEGDQGLSLENVRIFLCTIQNLMCAVTIENEKRFNEKHELVLSQQEALRLRKRFDMFNLNRLHFTEQRLVKPEETAQHVPQINESSRIMNESRRYESLAQLADKMTEVKKLKNEELLKKKQEQDDKILESCTFTPTIVAYVPTRGSKDNPKRKSKNSMVSKVEPSKDRCEDLFKLSQTKKSRKEKTKEDYELEKNQDELTFTPNLSVSAHKVDAKPVYAKNIEDTVNRLAIARKQTEIKKQMLSRGEPTTITVDKPFVCIREKQNKFQSTFDGLMKANTKSKAKPVKPHKQQNEPSKTTAKIEDGLKKTLNDFRRTEKAKQNREIPKEAPKKSPKVERPPQNEKRSKSDKPLGSPESQSSELPIEGQSNQLSQESNPSQQHPIQESPQNLQNEVSPQVEMPNTENSANQEVIKEESEDGSPPKNQNEENKPMEDDMQSKERVPLLYIDVNIGPNESERLEVYEGDTAEELSKQFALKHNLDKAMESKLEEMLNLQISSVLQKIEEENNASSDEERKRSYEC